MLAGLHRPQKVDESHANLLLCVANSAVSSYLASRDLIGASAIFTQYPCYLGIRKRFHMKENLRIQVVS